MTSINLLTAEVQAHPALVTTLLKQSQGVISKADCLNQLREKHIPFLNLGNVIYCQQQKLILFFQIRYLYAYEYCNLNQLDIKKSQFI